MNNAAATNTSSSIHIANQNTNNNTNGGLLSPENMLLSALLAASVAPPAAASADSFVGTDPSQSSSRSSDNGSTSPSSLIEGQAAGITNTHINSTTASTIKHLLAAMAQGGSSHGCPGGGRPTAFGNGNGPSAGQSYMLPNSALAAISDRSSDSSPPDSGSDSGNDCANNNSSYRSFPPFRSKGNTKLPIVVYMECDEESLSAYQCLLRKQIEIFEA
jgi:hypothetical protein